MNIVVVGSMAFDNVETPLGKRDDLIGGAATYFSLAASYFAPVSVVAVVGQDFPQDELAEMRRRGIELAGVEIANGKTFRWAGRYHENMNMRDTLDLQLNVFESFSPRLPDSYRGSEICFLANIAPGLQLSVLKQLKEPRLVGADTMNYWIENARPELEELLKHVELLTINEEEAWLLAGERNLVRAARRILEMGPKHLLVKRGEYGMIHFAPDSVFAVPAYPLENVLDPTGAGDTFAGGMMGCLASNGDFSSNAVRKAAVYGSVMASFVVEDFGVERLRALSREEIEQRYRQFVALTSF